MGALVFPSALGNGDRVWVQCWWDTAVVTVAGIPLPQPGREAAEQFVAEHLVDLTDGGPVTGSERFRGGQTAADAASAPKWWRSSPRTVAAPVSNSPTTPSNRTPISTHRWSHDGWDRLRASLT